MHMSVGASVIRQVLVDVAVVNVAVDVLVRLINAQAP
jgi:hypothetical protein